jgi:endoglucanase
LSRATSKLIAVWAILACSLFAASAASAQAPLSIRVDGNHFVNGDGQTIRLLGVDRTSSEYGCVDGFGYNDGHFDAADAAAIASWNANAVRIPLNEDCWLGINGQPNSNEGADPELTMLGYRESIENYVADLNADGIYAILDLHWTAPGTQVPLEQQPMPDKDHSPAFWQSVASTFKSDPAVVFDVFNEPYDPTDGRSGDDTDPEDKVTWNCWDTGTVDGTAGGAPCFTTAYDENDTKTSRYQVAGLQELVDTIRATGATQPVMTGGLDFANDLSQWVDHAPDDPLDQEAASFHNYMGKDCDNVGCWESEIAPVAANVPVVTGEFAEDDFENPTCGNKTPNSFDSDYMSWADAHGVSYLAWAWIVLSPGEIATGKCSAYYLITDYDGTPASPNGTIIRSHLQSLPAGGITGGSNTPAPSGGGGGATKLSIAVLRFQAKAGSDGKSASFTVEAGESCRGVLGGMSAKALAVGGQKPKKIALGSVSFALAANKQKTVVLKLSAAARQALAAAGTLRGAFTLSLSSAQNTTTVKQLSTTLKKAATGHRGGHHKGH